MGADNTESKPGNTGGQQPEALATFGAAARAGGEKPDDVGLTATRETAPLETDPKLKDDAATETLKAGVEKRTEKVADIVDDVPDRARSDAGGSTGGGPAGYG